MIDSHGNQLKKNVYPLNCRSSIHFVTERMPITKYSRKRQPQWRESDRLAQKEGLRHAVHSVNGDVYTGEWADNKKCGECSRRILRGWGGEMLFGIHGLFLAILWIKCVSACIRKGNSGMEEVGRLI